MKSNNYFAWLLMFEQFLAALKLRLTIWKEIKQKRPSISPSIRMLLQHKLRSWNILVKHEFQALRQRNWEHFISNVASPNPASFWCTAKNLIKKKSTDFCALTDENTTHRSTTDIINCLNQHFTERDELPSLNVNNSLEKEADEL
ncbi:unnamed protein product [Rotaria socialis]|uniref:Uncharacterized protein n=1 Tax=Rotaria socialis TaxID=392032 RepID=A0A818BKY7_9BILA|nr:unnamed protein product [Rotaria socialis]CAF3417932.1 unnamed protein product [Rotaria socialis]CAF3447120.1 unnamed protein product [Rotaria socialis]CAF3533250.1 unnamed protein product [Rotaria socialis]CAF3624601.1 unnamed protein product [Rotaria socialis]